MRVLVFGAGAIGSLLGGILSREHDVTLVGRAAHVEAIHRRGLRISGHTTLLAKPTATTTVPQGPFDLVLVTTKAYDTASAVEALRPFWRQSVFVTLQNGLGNAERIASAADHVLAGTTTHGVTFVAPGEIVHAGRGDTRVGPWQGTTWDDAQRVAGALTAAGLPTTVTANVRREVWGKVVVNAAINPLTAVLRRPNGALAEADDLRRLLGRVAREGVAAAGAAGVDLDPDELAGKAAEVASRTAENRSSMLQDVERGRRTEIEAIVGELLRVADEKGVPTPYLRTLFVLVRGLERAVPR
ncbi:MAG: ketopantoate reductase family protein [Euryarchaeota archaeon]|nr:ketopantoate reductase family protein [Euryarchaeota archaeon]